MNEHNNYTIKYNDDFDREYKLPDLLPISTLKELESAFKQAFFINFMILLENGDVYYAGKDPDKNHTVILKKILLKERIESIHNLSLGDETITLFPIKHELEVIGFFSLTNEKDPGPTSYKAINIGKFFLTVLNQIIAFRYRDILTSGLHGKVVEGSYLELKKRAELLEISEQKYRHLTENLELEVQRKTRKIKETQSQLLQQENLAAIGRLAAGMAHEINNPIGFIRSNLGTINEYINDFCSSLDAYEKLKSIVSKNNETCALKKELEQALDHIEIIQKKVDIPYIRTDLPNIISETMEGTKRIATIVSNLRDFSCIDLSEKTKIDINACIKNTLEVMAIVFKEDIEIVKKLHPLPIITCYPGKLNQAFMNILLNANQAIDKHGTIIVTSMTVKDHQIKNDHNGYIEVQIQDTGCGIPMENLNRIFEPFFTTREVGKGMGLGLTIAHDIIKIHRGNLTVESEAGNGTKFIIRIPIKNDD